MSGFSNLFIANLIFVLCWFFVNRRLGNALLLFSLLFLTVPIYSVSQSSSIFVVDLLLPFLLARYILTDKKKIIISPLLIFFSLFFFILPLVTSLINIIFDVNSIDQRAFLEVNILAYRALTIFVISLIAYNVGRSEFYNFKNVIKSITIYAGLFSFAGVLSFLSIVNLSYDYWDVGSDNIGIGDARGFAGLFRAAIALWFCIAISLHLYVIFNFLNKMNDQVLQITFFILSIVLIFFSFSRAGLLGIAPVVFIALYAYLKLSIKSVVGFSFFVCIVLLIYSFISYDDQFQFIVDRFSFSDGYGGDDAQSSRLTAWIKITDFFIEKPVFLFFGLSGFDNSILASLFSLYGSHNSYLDIVIRSGVFNFFIFLVFIIILFRKYFFRQSFLQIKFLVLSLLSSFFVVGFTQDIILLNSPLMYTTLGFFWSIIFYCIGSSDGYKKMAHT